MSFDSCLPAGHSDSWLFSLHKQKKASSDECSAYKAKPPSDEVFFLLPSPHQISPNGINDKKAIVNAVFIPPTLSDRFLRRISQFMELL